MAAKTEATGGERADKAKKGNSRKATTPEDRQLFGSKEEAEGNRPEGKERWRLFQLIRPDGTMRWTWTDGGGSALVRAALADGYAVVDLQRAPSKARVAPILAALPPADRAEVVAQYAARKGR